MATHVNGPLDLHKQLARIDRMLASAEKALSDIQQTRVGIDQVLVDIRAISFATIFQGLIAVAAFIGAGTAIAQLLFP